MKALFLALLQALRRGENAVLCNVIFSTGSTPRGAGAKMAVFQDGSTLGTIGGGAVEHAALKTALELQQSHTSCFKEFFLAPNQAADLGMVCGGNIQVFFQFFSPKMEEAMALVDHLPEAADANETIWLVTQIQDDASWSMGIYDEAHGMRFAAPMPLGQFSPLLCSKPMLQRGSPTYYVQPLAQKGMVYIFGGGHISQELVPVLAHLGFRPVVFEDREAFCNPALFPCAIRTVLGDFTRIGDWLSIGPEDYIVILTRGHQGDYLVLEQALRTQATYVGVIGSRRKQAVTWAKLREAGLGEGDIARIHNPIGLAIQAETPAEIAISIAGELILHRACLQ